MARNNLKIGKYDIGFYKFPYYLKILGRKFVNNIHTRPVFIIGNQRSGTTMLVSKLNRHFWIDVFHESSVAMEDWELKPFPAIKDLIDHSKAKVCIFKPLEDTHRVLDMLDNFEGSKAIFIFRHYSDVINSSIKLGWGKHLKQYIQNINDGIEFKFSGSLNLTAQNIQLIKELYQDNLSEENCIALIWYLRNTLFFDLNLSQNSSVLLIQYEKIVSDPKKEFKRIFDFINLPLSSSVFYDISAKNVGKAQRPQLDKKIAGLCDAMFDKLVASVK